MAKNNTEWPDSLVYFCMSTHYLELEKNSWIYGILLFHSWVPGTDKMVHRNSSQLSVAILSLAIITSVCPRSLVHFHTAIHYIEIGQAFLYIR